MNAADAGAALARTLGVLGVASAVSVLSAAIPDRYVLAACVALEVSIAWRLWAAGDVLGVALVAAYFAWSATRATILRALERHARRTGKL